MKRKLLFASVIFVSVIAMLCVMMFKNVSYGYTEAVDGITWYYEVLDGEAVNVRISSVASGTDVTTLNIPSELGGYTVTGVRGNGSYSIWRNNEYRVTTINIPDTVKTIGDNSFRNFYNATTINIGSGVESIGYRGFYGCSSVQSLTLSDSVKTIGNNAFYNCSSLTSIDLGSSLTSIGDYAFYYTKVSDIVLPDSLTELGYYSLYGISNPGGKSVTIGAGFTTMEQVGTLDYMYNLEEYKVSETNTAFSAVDGVLYSKDGTVLLKCPPKKEFVDFVMPSTVKKIADSVFQYKTINGTFTFSPVLEEIGDYAFAGSGLSGELVIPDTVKKIGYYAFQGNYNLTGDLTLNGVESIGEGAFYYCYGLDGVLTIGDKAKTIDSYAFYETYFNKVSIGSGIEEIKYASFEYYNDIWINRLQGEVTLGTISTSTDPYIHWANDTHRVRVSTLPGIKLVNAETGAVLTSGYYPCESEFTYKIVIEDGYDYSGLSLVEINAGDSDNFVSYEVDTDRVYNFDRLIRTRDLYIQGISQGTDLALRTFITEINREKVSKNREPRVVIQDGFPAYMHTKYPVVVKTGDSVTFNVRVYNEGIEKASAKKIAIYLPEGLTLDTSNKLNEYWTSEGNGKYTTTKLENKKIASNIGNGVLSYSDVQFIAKITTEKPEDEDILKAVFAEIEETSSEDTDSSRNIDIDNPSNFDLDEIYASDSASIISGQEDDDDFEVVVLKGRVKIDYAIKVDKIDANSDKLLKGATFALKDEEGNVVSTAVTGDDGSLVFDTITTYGDGEDIWFIEETKAPAGYENIELKKIKVRVEKTIINEDRGLYSVQVFCDTADYSINYERYDFTPIKTADQLKKMGSGDVVTVDGVDYEYNIDTFYKLENDIDLDGEEWTPIVPEMECILDGNGHKISNLTITSDEDLTRAEVGLFSSFSGAIENLELENVNIDIEGFTQNAETKSGKTGVGAFAGVMGNGIIKNCKITGDSRVAARTDNIGGFVGHTLEDGYVVIENCINNADVSGKTWTETVIEEGEPVTKNSGSSNVGGFVGCALGSFTVKNSENNGDIHGEMYNAGGIVGFAMSSDYRETGIIGGFDETNKVIELVVENDKGTYGTYNLGIEIIDENTHQYLPDAVYTVYGGDKEIIDGLDHVLIENGKLNLLTEDAKTTGYDRYYMIENTPVDGYPQTSGVIRLVVERYWDDNSRTYKVRATCTVISEEQFNEETAQTEEEKETPGPSYTGQIFDERDVFTETEIEKANWNYRKEEFIDCENNGNVSVTRTNAAGMLGATYGVTSMKNCTNNGDITSKLKSAGMIAELRTKDVDADNVWSEDERAVIETQDTDEYSEIISCINNGKITNKLGENETSEDAWLGNAGGIVSELTGNAKISESINRGQVSAYGPQSAGGIVGDMEGKLEIDKSDNEGKLSTVSAQENTDVDAVVGGLVAKNYTSMLQRNESSIKITNSNNYGELSSSNHTGGIVALATGNELIVDNCNVNNSLLEVDESTGEKPLLKIHTVQTGDKGGIVGNCSAKDTVISNCSIENVEFKHDNTTTDSYGSTGGIVGISPGNVDPYRNETISVINCKVDSCDILSYGKEVAGVIGMQYGSYSGKKVDTDIIDCRITNNNIITTMPISSGSTYAAAAGLYGASYETGTLNIENCLVEGGKIQVINQNEEYASSDVAGLIASDCYADEINIRDTDVVNVDIENTMSSGLGSSNSCVAGGIAHVLANGWSDLGKGYITIDSCNFTNLNLKSVSGTVGGAIAFTNNASVDIDGVNVTECSMKLTEECSNNCIGGLFGCPQSGEYLRIKNIKVIGKKTNTESEKTKLEAHIANMGGLVGHINYVDTEIENAEVKNLVLKNNADSYVATYSMAAILGSNGANCIMTDCLADNCDVSGDYIDNVGGAIGITYSPLTMERVTVKDSSFSNQKYGGIDDSSRQATAAALVSGCTSSDFSVEDCHVLRCNVLGKGNSTAGAVGYAGGIVANNCSVENTTVTNNWEYSDSIIEEEYHNGISTAGFVGSVTSQGSLSNISVKDTTCNTKYGSVGGVYGYINSLEKIENTNTQGLTLKCTDSKSFTNGAVAAIGANTDNINCDINDLSDTGSSIETVSHLAGGLFGYIQDSVTIDGCSSNGTTIVHKNIKFDACPVDEDEPQSITDGVCGGIVAMANEAIIENCTVTGGSITANSSITQEGEYGKSVHVGGIEGFLNYHTTINNCTVSGLTILNNSNGITGGIGGLNQKGRALNGENINVILTTNNCKVQENTQINSTQHAGGILGLGYIKSKGDSVKNSSITIIDSPYTYYNAGGIVGIGETDSIVDNGTVDNVTITTYSHPGGIAGVYVGTIKNSTVTNSKMRTISGASSTSGCAGGLAGILSSGTAQDSTVTNCEVSTTTNHAGGAVGCTTGTIKNVSVTNTIITASNLAGGVLGAGSTWGTTLENLTVSGNTINGNTSVMDGDGTYIGAPNIYVPPTNPNSSVVNPYNTGSVSPLSTNNELNVDNSIPDNSLNEDNNTDTDNQVTNSEEQNTLDNNDVTDSSNQEDGTNTVNTDENADNNENENTI